MLHRQAREAEIHRLRQHRLHDVLGGERLHMDLARQQFAIERRECGRHEARGQRRDRREAEHRERAGADRGGALRGCASGPSSSRSTSAWNSTPFGGRADARAVPGKQEIADIGLEILDLPRHHRLRTAEQARRAGDAAGRHHGGEGLEQANVDHVIMHCSIMHHPLISQKHKFWQIAASIYSVIRND